MKTTQHHLAASSTEARADQEPQAILRIELEYDDGDGQCEIICRGTETHMRMLDARLKFLHRLEQQSDVAEVVEKIAKEWDGCMAPMFDPAGNPTDPLDIGATIRDAHGAKGEQV